MEFLEFPVFGAIPHLRHALTTRAGGQSSGAYSSLNLAFHVGDAAETVRSNRHILAHEMGFEAENLVCAQQTHGDNIGVVLSQDVGRGALDWESAILDTDALVTGERGVPLLILVADCAPILLIDPQKRVLAVVHAGWRGAVAGIAGKTVRLMENRFGCAPDDILAGIGPCLCAENLEIGPEVAAQIERVDADAIISGFIKPHLDLRGLLQRDLERAGLDSSHLDTMNLCPKNEGERFFSHRGQNGVTGRFGLLAWWQ